MERSYSSLTEKQLASNEPHKLEPLKLPWSAGALAVRDVARDTVAPNIAEGKFLKEGKFLPHPSQFRHYSVLDDACPDPAFFDKEEFKLITSDKRAPSSIQVSLEDLKKEETSARRTGMVLFSLDWQVAAVTKKLTDLEEVAGAPVLLLAEDLFVICRFLLSIGRPVVKQLRKHLGCGLIPS